MSGPGHLMHLSASANITCPSLPFIHACTPYWNPCLARPFPSIVSQPRASRVSRPCIWQVNSPKYCVKLKLLVDLAPPPAHAAPLLVDVASPLPLPNSTRRLPTHFPPPLSFPLPATRNPPPFPNNRRQKSPPRLPFGPRSNDTHKGLPKHTPSVRR